MLNNLDNIDVAVLSKLNELAGHYGLKPYHFIATLDNSTAMDGLGLKFVVPAETGDREQAIVKKMLRALGVDERGTLKGGEIAVVDALDNAVSIAPKQRPR